MADEEMSIEEKAEEKFWMNLISRYWYFMVILVLIIAGAVVGFIFVVDWYVKTSVIGGFGTWTFNDFSLGEAILWCLFLFLWSLLFIGLPVLGIGGLVLAIAWFVVLPDDVKADIKARPKKMAGTKRTGGSGGFSFILFLGVCIKVFLDGNWFTKFSLIPIGYFIYTWLFVLIWVLIIFGIPAAVIGISYLLWKRGKTA